MLGEGRSACPRAAARLQSLQRLGFAQADWQKRLAVGCHSSQHTGGLTENLRLDGAGDGWTLTATHIHMGHLASSRQIALQCSDPDPLPGWGGTHVYTDFSLEI